MQNTAFTRRFLSDGMAGGLDEVTSLVKLMEKKGYIQREAVPGDARLKKIVLTPEGRATAIRVKETLDSMELDILKGISQEELQTYFAVADKIKNNLDIQKPTE